MLEKNGAWRMAGGIYHYYLTPDSIMLANLSYSPWSSDFIPAAATVKKGSLSDLTKCANGEYSVTGVAGCHKVIVVAKKPIFAPTNVKTPATPLW